MAEILIVDDEKALRDSLKIILLGEGFEVRMARDGEEALEKIAELENLTVTDEDTEAEIKKIAGMYGLETDKVKEQVSPDMLAEDIKVGKAVDIVKANAVITDKAPEAAE